MPSSRLPLIRTSKTLYTWRRSGNKVAVFEGKFRISCDARINANPDFVKSLGADWENL